MQEHKQHRPSRTPPATSASGPGITGGAVAAGGIPMIVMIRMMIGGMATMARHVEGRLAFLKSELEITEPQLPLWTGLADAVRANASSVSNMPDAMESWPTAPLPERLAWCEKTMAAHLQALERLKAAVDPLYTTPSEGQKKTADELFMGAMMAVV